MQLFSANVTMFFKKVLNSFFAHENMKNCSLKFLIIGQKCFFFRIANRSKISPNLIFCSIKMAPCATSVQYIMTLVETTLESTSVPHICSTYSYFRTFDISEGGRNYFSYGHFISLHRQQQYIDLVQFSKKVVMYKLNQLASLFYFLIEERPFLLSEFLSVWFLWCMAMAGARVKKFFFMTANKAIQMNYICYHVRFTICVFVQVFLLFYYFLKQERISIILTVAWKSVFIFGNSGLMQIETDKPHWNMVHILTEFSIVQFRSPFKTSIKCVQILKYLLDLHLHQIVQGCGGLR